MSDSRRHWHANAVEQCIGSEKCTQPVVPESPVALCGKHIREVYAFASDLLESNWDGAVRDYVSALHDQFKPPRVVKQPAAGWVYAIRFGDRVKVGYTTDPETRMRNLPHEQVLAMVHGTRADEKAWHDLLADFHVTGEWFQAHHEVLTVLTHMGARSA